MHSSTIQMRSILIVGKSEKLKKIVTLFLNITKTGALELSVTLSLSRVVTSFIHLTRKRVS